MRGYWWLSHTIAVFWSIWFPVHTRKIRRTRYIKVIHITTIVIVFILSVIPIGVLFATGGYVLSSYTVSLGTCVPRNLTAAMYISPSPYALLYLQESHLANLLTVWKLLKIRHRPSQVYNIITHTTYGLKKIHAVTSF